MSFENCRKRENDGTFRSVFHDHPQNTFLYSYFHFIHRLGTKRQGVIFLEEEDVRKRIGRIRCGILEKEERLAYLKMPCPSPNRALLVRPNVQQIELGFSHSICIVKEDVNRVYCWGNNEFGQLGLGDFVNRAVPCLMNLDPSRNICRVAAGYFHSGFVCTEGYAYTFGSSSHNQLGYSIDDSNDDDNIMDSNCEEEKNDYDDDDDSVRSVHTARRLNVFYSCEYGESRGAMQCDTPCVKSLHLGNEMSAIVTSKGELFTFGDGGDGKLGHGGRKPEIYPLRVRLSFSLAFSLRVSLSLFFSTHTHTHTYARNICNTHE